MSDLVDLMFSGDRLALSRLISEVESHSPNRIQIMSRVQEKCGRAYKIGITGPPGAGKSTLVDRLIACFRKQGGRVGVVAIDPSSPFSGGALLGDRIRMQDHTSDEGVFIRSLGSRGSHGGISRATREVVKLYDAFGMDFILVETVGVGQTELDIMGIVDATVVIVTPESGDAIQTLKAGILEIADIFVVNKADRDGAPLMQAELKAMLELGQSSRSWSPPVLLTSAVREEGLLELMQALQEYRAYLSGKGKKEMGEKKKNILREEAQEIILEELRFGISRALEKEIKEEDNPYQLAENFLKKHTLK